MESVLLRSVYDPPRAQEPWALSDYVGHARLRLYSLGRWALAEALRLARAQGQDVLVPEFICREVLSALAAAGARPVFYPVGRDLAPSSDPDDWPRAAAVLCVDYFGFPQNLAPFERYARRTQAILIEDNAHGLLSRDEKGRALGTRAALGVLSLRKTLPLADGGALLVNEERLWSQAPAQLPAAQTANSYLRRRQRLRRLSRWLGAKGMARAIDGLRRLRSLAAPASGALDPEAERRIPLPPPPCPEALESFQAVGLREEVERRRALYALCARLLEPAGVEPVFARLPDQTTPYLYPFRASAAQAKKADAILKSRGLLSLPWPAPPEALVGRLPEFHTAVRGVHFLW